MNRLIEDLIESLRVLNGVGEKTARRYAYELLASSPKQKEQLISALTNLNNVQECTRCHNYTLAKICDICQSVRMEEILIVVESPKDIDLLERITNNKYYYHVLGGIIDPMHDVNVEDLNFKNLKSRLNDKIKEIIVVLPTTMEGEMTINYLKQFVGSTYKVSKLAQGIPIGGNLDYVDEITLLRSLESRQSE